MGPNSRGLLPLQKGSFGHRGMQRRRMVWRDTERRQRLGQGVTRPRRTTCFLWTISGWSRAPNGLPQGPRKEPALPTGETPTANIQTYETINKCCLGALGWLGQLSIWFLVSAQVVVSGLGDPAHRAPGSAQSRPDTPFSLSVCLSAPPSLSLQNK